MGPKLLLILWICLFFATGTSFKARCKVPSVQAGDSTNITCYFGMDTSKNRIDSTVHKYHDDNDGSYTDILNCLWRSNDGPDCKTEQGYVLTGNVTDTLVLHIASASEEHVGTYACMTIPSDWKDLERCTFTLRYDNTRVEFSTQPTNTTNSNPEANDNNTTVVVVVVIIVVVLAFSIALLIYIRRRKINRDARNARQKTTDTTGQRLLHETDEKIEKFEKDCPPIDHDTYDKALKHLEEEDVVIIMGPEKCGKTTIGRALQRYFKGKEYTPLDLNQHDSWNQFRHFTGKLIILLDEVFTIGGTLTDEVSWSSVFRSMKVRECPVIVIIKTDTGPEDVGNNFVQFMKDFPKVVVNGNLQNELFRVCKSGELNDLKNLLRHHVDVNATNTKGENSLHVACALHRQDIVEVLLDVTQAQDSQGQTPLYHAQDSQGQTPLHHACNRYEATEAKSDVVESATSTDEVDDDQSKSVSRADDDENEQRVLIATNTSDEIRNTEHVDPQDQNTEKTGAHATQEGDKNVTGTQGDKITELLLKHGAEPEVKDSTGRTPLHLACDKGNRAAVASLLEFGVNIETEDQKGIRPLHLACQNGNAEIINSLLCRKCMVDARDKQQWTPLQWACENDKDVAVRVLVQHGANVEADVHGVRPLHVASRKGNKQIVQILLDQNADVNAKDPNGQKPSGIAKTYEHHEVVQLLKERKPKGGMFRL